MREKKHQGHNHGRNPRGFESHATREASGHGGYVRKGKAWRFYDQSKLFVNPCEPHFRTTARTPALPGKHIRSVPEPVRPSHGKDA